MVQVTVLDYGAGNVRSVKNAIRAVGHTVVDAQCADDIRNAAVVVFPGVGNFRQAMQFLNSNDYGAALKEYIAQDRPFLGICLGMQTLFEGSAESPELKGLGVIKGRVERFPTESMAVPHIGWNGVNLWKQSALFADVPQINEAKVYFVHSYCVLKTDKNADWVLTTTNYGDVEFVSAVQKGNVMATQFHPEKSGAVGLALLRGFLEKLDMTGHDTAVSDADQQLPTQLAKRVIAYVFSWIQRNEVAH